MWTCFNDKGNIVSKINQGLLVAAVASASLVYTLCLLEQLEKLKSSDFQKIRQPMCGVLPQLGSTWAQAKASLRLYTWTSRLHKAPKCCAVLCSAVQHEARLKAKEKNKKNMLNLFAQQIKWMIMNVMTKPLGQTKLSIHLKTLLPRIWAGEIQLHLGTDMLRRLLSSSFNAGADSALRFRMLFGAVEKTKFWQMWQSYLLFSV